MLARPCPLLHLQLPPLLHFADSLSWYSLSLLHEHGEVWLLDCVLCCILQGN